MPNNRKPIKEKHIGKLNGADKDIFLIGEAYPGVWLEHVYDSVMYAKLFSARKQARFCGTNSTAQRRCDRQQFTRTNNTKVLWGSAPSPAHFAAKRRSDFRGRTIRKFYGALPHTPPTFLKKVGEKQCFTAKYPTHSVRAAAKRRCNTRGRAS